MRFLVRKSDLDTCLAGLLAGARPTDPVNVVDSAPESCLSNPETICLEAGGSGRVLEGNFDHHDPRGPLEPACVQAFRQFGVSRLGAPAARVAAIVSYVRRVDLGLPIPPRTGTSLSALFSGLRLAIEGEGRRFHHGVELLRRVAEGQGDPTELTVIGGDWADYMDAKADARSRVTEDARERVETETRGGLRIALAVSPAPGLLGRLKSSGADIAVGRREARGGHWRTTISGPRRAIVSIRSEVTRWESGWGGPSHDRVLGGPHSGSGLDHETLLRLIGEVA